MTHDPLYETIAETASTDDPSLHRVLIVGGGAGGLRLTSLLGATLGRRRKASITLLDKSRIHVWKPLLHEVASGSMDSETDSVELIAHARQRHYRYRIGEMIGLEPRQAADLCRAERGRGRPDRHSAARARLRHAGHRGWQHVERFRHARRQRARHRARYARSGVALQPPHDQRLPARQCAIRAVAAGPVACRHRRRRRHRRRAGRRTAQIDARRRVVQSRPHRFRRCTSRSS